MSENSDKEVVIACDRYFVADASVRVQSINVLHLLLVETEVVDLDVLLDVWKRATSGDGNGASSDSPI